MCGFFGILNFRETPPPEPALLDRMGKTLVHRGPDQSGLYSDSLMTLGHRRLSVIDLSECGRQPMSNHNGTIWIVFNGEIYNFGKIRPDLEKRGFRFRSSSDTEVLLHLLESEGIRGLQELRGMFAFAIWDTSTRKLLLARDRLGKKPLVYYQDAHGLIFASEIKCLLQHPRVSRELDSQALDEYLTYQYIPAPHTIFRAIRKLPPAHYLTCDSGQVKVGRYWNLDYEPKIQGTSEQELQALLVDRLEDATRIRLKSDVPLGAFLSGGVDSSAVVALMARHSSRPVKTFSIGFKEGDYNELPYARQLARHIGTEHHEFIVEPKAVEILPKLIWHYDEPYSDSSALPSFYLAQMTREHVTVALNGDGGDEAFAGYEKYLAMGLLRLLNGWPSALRKGFTGLGRFLPEQAVRRTALRKLKRLLQSNTGSFEHDYLRLMVLFDRAEKERLYSSQFLARLEDLPSAEDFLLKLLAEGSHLTWIDRIGSVDVQSYLPYDLLVKIDIASMANSLEVRSPFLDHQFLEFAACLPAHLKCQGSTTKRILKKAFEGILPQSVLQRRKMGFGVPLNHWFRGPLQGFARETLLTGPSQKRGYFETNYVRQLLEDHVGGRKDNAYKIWNLLTLEVWHQVYLDA
ncbi:MAG: asparagine synthase (glutamine-hydrolyzing) [Acidobacteriota bacterium]